MLKIIINDVKSINFDILKVMHKFFTFSLILFVLSLYILFLYNTYPFSYALLDSSLLIFKISLCIVISSFLSGFVINKIRNT